MKHKIYHLLHDYIPPQFFEKALLNDVTIDGPNSDLFIRFIKNSAVCEAITEGLTLSKYQVPYEFIKSRAGYYAVRMDRDRLSDLEDDLFILKKEEAHHKIKELYIPKTKERAEHYLLNLKEAIARHSYPIEKFAEIISKVEDYKSNHNSFEDMLELDDAISKFKEAYEACSKAEKEQANEFKSVFRV